ncbi:MAG: hypothetical protein H6739_09345 [Alphaproteobacteria bacterium]|nr:hypothetical protein [Alphaproteobacteria bacterium]
MRLTLSAALLMAAGCAENTPIDLGLPEGDEGIVELDPPEDGVQVVSGPMVVPPYSEFSWCTVTPLGNARRMLVNRLEHQSSKTVHHFNVYLVGITPEGPMEGLCDEVWDELSMGVVSPVYGSQTEYFRGDFPEGVAGSIPGEQWVVLEHHALNPTDRPQWTQAIFNAWAVDRDEVEYVANGIFGSNTDIDIPPGESRVFRKSCYVDKDMWVFAFGSHTHQLGTEFEIFRMTRRGQAAERLYHSTDWQAPEVTVLSDEPIFIPAGAGLQYRCHYTNDTDALVGYGLTASDEMCMMAAVYYPDDGFKRCRSTPP